MRTRFLLLPMCLAPAPALAAPAPVAPPPGQGSALAQRVGDSTTGESAQLFPGALPPGLDKRVPVPSNAVLVGSVAFTPLQRYAEHGVYGTVELYYDLSSAQAREAYLADVQRAGWQSHAASQPGSRVFCRSDGPAVVVNPGFMRAPNTQLRVTVFDTAPGWTPCR